MAARGPVCRLMTRIPYTQTVDDRNAEVFAELRISPHLSCKLEHRSLSPAGRVIYRRTRWSTSLCNAIAVLAGLGSAEEA